MTALILVDIQNDFLPGGSLAVPHADEILPVARKLMEEPFDLVVATQDWHPKRHISFASRHERKPGQTVLVDELVQTLWPDHCVQHSHGAELHASLLRYPIHYRVHKGEKEEIDSYSAFFDNAKKRETILEPLLRKHQVHTVVFAGLATDYCVLKSVVDACTLGFNVWVVADGCRAVDLAPGDGEKALEVMRQAGAKIIDSSAIKQALSFMEKDVLY